LQQTLDSDGTGIVGHGLHYFRLDEFSYDGFGSQETAKDSTHVFIVSGGGGGGTTTVNSRTFGHFGAGGVDLSRLSNLSTAFQTNLYNYDGAGNTTFIEGSPKFENQDDPGAWDDRVTFYDALGRVAGAEHGSRANDDVGLGLFRRIQEDYRYDALGRRILVRLRQYCANHPTGFEAGCRVDWVRRTVWDGDRESWEIQMPDDSIHREWDTAIDTVDMFSSSPVHVDLNPQFGRVDYIYGARGTDQPIAVSRLEYSDHPANGSLKTWAPFTNVLLWNERGHVDNSAYSDGAKTLCDSADPTRCVLQAWPAGYFAYARDIGEFGFWHGSLIRDKRDGTGTLYRRRRYYDPATGQFTQEDPIGLAGGLNLYGFASGDPVNFSDPFGLSANCIVNPARCAREGAARVKAAVARIGLAIGNVIGELTGVNDAIRVGSGIDPPTGNRVSTGGRVLAGAMLGAAAFPPSGGSRALRAADLGLEAVEELRGTVSVAEGVATVRIDMIAGEIANPFGVIGTLRGLAGDAGATTLRIEGTIANEQLYNVLKARYGLRTEGGLDVIELAVP